MLLYLRSLSINIIIIQYCPCHPLYSLDTQYTLEFRLEDSLIWDITKISKCDLPYSNGKQRPKCPISNLLLIVRNEQICCIPKSIHRLDFWSNPIWKRQRREIPRKIHISESYWNVQYYLLSLNGRRKEDYYNSDVEYALRINHGGRRILGSAFGDQSFPLSIWHTILERSYNFLDIYDAFGDIDK